MAAQAPVEQPAAYAEGDADCVSHPVAHVCAAVKRGLYELDEAAEGACTNEDRNQPQAAGAGQREGECGEGDEVHELVAALWRGRGRLEGPEHGQGQGDGHKGCEGDVEVLAHGAGVAGAPGKGKGKRLEVAVNVAQPCPAPHGALHILPMRYRSGINPFILGDFRYSDRGYPRLKSGR